jgi:hypothetical protein
MRAHRLERGVRDVSPERLLGFGKGEPDASPQAVAPAR